MTQGTARPGDTAGRIVLLLGGLFVLGFAARFWLHDVFPYFSDFTEGSYRRFWPNRFSLIPHIVGGSVALFTGPIQLWLGVRQRVRRIHRVLGYVYMAAIVMSAGGSFYLAFFARPDFGLSLFVLAVVWLITIAMALVAIRNKRVDTHREWMIRSYIVTFAFVSYRFLVKLPMLKPLEPGLVPTALWASWVVPMIVYEVVSQWHRTRPLKRPVATTQGIA